jgi:hypothetical protein
MVQTHQDSCEKGMTTPYPLQETENIWHGSPDPSHKTAEQLVKWPPRLFLLTHMDNKQQGTLLLPAVHDLFIYAMPSGVCQIKM